MILAIVLGLVALVCLYLEFFLPGGIFGLAAAVVALGGTAYFFLEAPARWMGALYAIALVVLGAFTVLLALKTVAHSNNTFSLKNDQEGYVSNSIEQDLVGKEGVVTTELKPSGHVRVDGKVYQAVSDGGFIVQKTVVEVISARGSHLVVKVKQ